MYATRGCGSGTSPGRKGDGTAKVYTPRGIRARGAKYGGWVGDAIGEWRSDDLRKAMNKDAGGERSTAYVQSHGWRTREY